MYTNTFQKVKHGPKNGEQCMAGILKLYEILTAYLEYLF